MRNTTPVSGLTAGRKPFLLIVCSLLIVSGCSWTQLVSVDNAKQQGNSISQDSSVSADGRYIAFESVADNLVAGDTNGTRDVFVRDVVSRVTERVSVSSAGGEGSDSSEDASISADGRFVAFSSESSDLVANDTNGMSDIFVRDRQTGTTTRVSVDSVGDQGNAASRRPEISGDGNWVVFRSAANNLVPMDNNNRWDTFLHNRITGVTTRVSVDSLGAEGNSDSLLNDITSDGTLIAFSSFATNLVSSDTNAASDVFVHNRVTGTTTRVSVDSSAMQANQSSSDPAISADGRYVVFHSMATNLVAGDSNNLEDVFVHDLQTGATTRVNLDENGNQSLVFPRHGTSSVSGDGRYIAFSTTEDFASSDVNGVADVYIRDQVAGRTFLGSLSAAGAQTNHGNGISQNPYLSEDGRYVAFESGATNLVPGDNNGELDVFIRAVGDMSVTSVSPSLLAIGSTTSVTITGTNFLPGTAPWLPGLWVRNIVRVNETTLTADITVPNNLSPASFNVGVFLLGTGAGQLTGLMASCDDCLTIF
ncbi:MAG: hypothetical protein Hals2KO_19830 [Halioglobus sp.]